MKYIAHYLSWLGKNCDTPEEAQIQARGIDYYFDRGTGFSSAFNCEVPHEAEVTAIPDEVPEESWEEIEDAIDRAEEELEKEIEQLRRERLRDLYAKKTAYINNKAPFEYNDTIKLVVKVNGRKKTYTDRVTGVFITDEGEIRPNLYGKNYPIDAEIISIEVLEKHDFSQDIHKVSCKNCLFADLKEGKWNPLCTKKQEYVGACDEHQECFEHNEQYNKE